MKINNTLKTILTALLLGTGLSGASAASLLADGDFDSLPVGTAPDVGTPAGNWFWPAGYPTAEADASQFSIVPAPGGGTGNCLLRSLTGTEFPANRFDLPNLLGRSVTKASGEILHVSFDIYVAPGRGGGAVVLGKGMVAGQDRGPQLVWCPTGELSARSAGIVPLISSYPWGVWQTVRLEVDLAHDRFNFYWSEKGQPVSVIRSNLGLQSGTIPYIDRLNIVRFGDDEVVRNVHSYIDNIRVTTDPAIAPVDAHLPAGGATTLELVNVPAGVVTFQWQRNGTNLTGKTSRFLTFSSLLSALLAAEGDYTVVVSDANGSVVSQPATLRVLLTPAFTQAPLSQSVVAGGNVTFSAGISGNPAPFTYQSRKGTSFAASTLVANVESGERTTFLTLTNVQPTDAGTYRLNLANAAVPTLTSASPNRAWTLTVLPDTDGDGLPDEWETANGLALNDPSDALTDADGDRMSNRAEYQSGTSPTNAASLLRLETVTQANGKATLSFQAAAYQTYTVESSTQPAGGPWSKLVDVSARSYDHVESVTDSNAAAPSRFYRAITPRRP